MNQNKEYTDEDWDEWLAWWKKHKEEDYNKHYFSSGLRLLIPKDNKDEQD